MDRTRGTTRRAFMASLITTLAATVGCRSLNEDPRNTRYWFPTLIPPSREEREQRERYFPEGGDPYVDADVGPKSLAPRPNGWDIQRSRGTRYGITGDE